MTSPSSFFTQATRFVAEKGVSGNYNDDSKLKLYALFKQATEGDLPSTEPQPSRFSFAARAKYDARAAIRGLDQTQAKSNYVELLISIDPRFKPQLQEQPTNNTQPPPSSIPPPSQSTPIKPSTTTTITTSNNNTNNAATTDILSTPLTLNCGLTLPGRLIKAAMTEGLADEYAHATTKHDTLYSTYSTQHNGGHVLITGNVQIDRRFVERPGNVCIEGPQDEQAMNRLKSWAIAAQKDGTKCIVQLGHAGRQASALVSTTTVAPSPIKVKMIGVPTPTPREATREEIFDIIERFGHAALVCKQAGFAGVQLHSAHGYLLSSFLTPKANRRNDEFGGSLENRARVLLQIIKTVRTKVGPDFCISVKLNSADFQRGGMTPEEAQQVALWLEELGVDFLELSGGSYESPAMMFGEKGFDEMQSLSSLGKTSTELREGYFLLFAELLKKTVKRMPCMVTGGFRSRLVMEQAILKGSVDLIGIGRPLCGDPECVGKLLRREINELPRWEKIIDLPIYAKWLRYIIVGNLLHAGAFQMWTYSSLLRMGDGKKPILPPQVDIVKCLIQMDRSEKLKAKNLQGLDKTKIVGLAFNNDQRRSLINLQNIVKVVLVVIVVRFIGKKILNGR
jgi:2,4-dienoyl-CoA reductase-like NADH-dependent reductase (Old Yellow Enzyme family)/acyl-CoA-binding protein